MKRLLFLLLLALAASPTVAAQARKKREAEAFRRHFQRLDSLALLSPDDNVSNCPLEVKFMQAHTGINSKASGDYLGLLHCYKSDLRAWHAWYAQHYASKKWYARKIK